MAKKFHHHVEEKYIPAGMIRRHPLCQRPSQLKRFREEFGDYDEERNRGFIHVVADGDDGWFAFNGGHRTELCKATPAYGPRHKLRCKVYGNGRVPTVAETAELFLQENTDLIPVSPSVEFEQSVLANRPDAVAAKKICQRLGSTFRGPIGIWALVKDHGQRFADSVVDEVLSIWGTKEEIPLCVVRAVATILQMKDGAATLKKRRAILKTKAPTSWVNAAKLERLRQVGTRPSLQTFLIKKLFGRSTG